MTSGVSMATPNLWSLPLLYFTVQMVTVIAVPLYGDGAVTAEEQTRVQDMVQNKYGPRSLHPSVIALLAEGKSEREGPLAYQVLREILLVEHTVGQHYFNRITPYAAANLVHVTGQTPYVKAQLAEIEPCWAKRPVDLDVLSSLMDDIYTSRDSNCIFGFPATVDGKNEADSRPTLETKITSANTLAPLVRTALGLLSTTTALVLVDANYTYYGHIYTGASSKYGGMDAIGIRTSMANLVCRALPGVTQKIFHGLLMWGATHNYNHVRVLAPFDSAQPLLLKLGFVFDQPSKPILYYAGTTKDISTKEYGVYYTELMRPLFTTSEFEVDAEALVEVGDMILEAARSHLQFRLLTNPRSLLTSDLKAW